MSEIKVGDLVVVCRPCPHCGDNSDLGVIFRVKYLGKCDQPIDCCKNVEIELCADPEYPDSGWPVRILRKIDPLSELESIERKEELTA